VHGFSHDQPGDVPFSDGLPTRGNAVLPSFSASLYDSSALLIAAFAVVH
jgi:hypothetical protein